MCLKRNGRRLVDSALAPHCFAPHSHTHRRTQTSNGWHHPLTNVRIRSVFHLCSGMQCVDIRMYFLAIRVRALQCVAQMVSVQRRGIGQNWLHSCISVMIPNEYVRVCFDCEQISQEFITANVLPIFEHFNRFEWTLSLMRRKVGAHTPTHSLVSK